jgi:hypothetical protein
MKVATPHCLSLPFIIIHSTCHASGDPFLILLYRHCTQLVIVAESERKHRDDLWKIDKNVTYAYKLSPNAFNAAPRKSNDTPDKPRDSAPLSISFLMKYQYLDSLINFGVFILRFW